MRSSKSRSRSKQNRSRSVGNVVNRVFDSSGPEGKVRGTPQQIIDKYNQLARDAQLSNDRVAAENFQQHSEHYTRMLGEAMREMEAQRPSQGDYGGQGGGQGGQNGSSFAGQNGGQNGGQDGGSQGGGSQTYGAQGEGSQGGGYRQREDRNDRTERRPDTRNDNRPERSPDKNNESRGDQRPHEDRGPREDRSEGRSDEPADGRPGPRPDTRRERRPQAERPVTADASELPAFLTTPPAAATRPDPVPEEFAVDSGPDEAESGLVETPENAAAEAKPKVTRPRKPRAQKPPPTEAAE
jgi:hypothetical protein